ncbi:release factor glutamine methyltransferase [Motilibacter rhizosphaerae]|uniref:peptide chain release factor N(5)-glutamine methyltransferase n=1 Tax=Motilibacter rhizosphaerae TaxID=598652 RepID=A0A4Q7NS53_9ACTN|nr:release factor glutamine methyltransferase [Motilibacter rhizosphaerae]
MPDLVARLRAAGCVFAEDEARLLLADGRDLEPLVARRVVGEPLEQVLGWAELAGVRVALAPGVFVPRQRSAHLVEHAAVLARPGSVVVDLCCGSGALGLAVARAVPGVRLVAADLDPVAVACAAGNLAGVGTAYQGDLCAALPPELRGRVDVLVANAPYVPSGAVATLPPEARDHEPLLALDGGVDGLDVHRRIAAEAREWLAPGGTLLVETGEEQAGAAVALLEAAGLHADVDLSEEWGSAVVSGRRR